MPPAVDAGLRAPDRIFRPGHNILFTYGNYAITARAHIAFLRRRSHNFVQRPIRSLFKTVPA